jgi:hypothetical protein
MWKAKKHSIMTFWGSASPIFLNCQALKVEAEYSSEMSVTTYPDGAYPTRLIVMYIIKNSGSRNLIRRSVIRNVRQDFGWVGAQIIWLELL